MSHDEQFGTMWSSIDFDYGKLRRLPSTCGFLKINLKFVAVLKINKERKLVLGSVRGHTRGLLMLILRAYDWVGKVVVDGEW